MPVHFHGVAGITRVTRFWPSIEGRDFACMTSSAGSVMEVETMPRMAPCIRRWRVRARVSMPSMPGTPCCCRKSGREHTERQLEGVLQHSLTMRAAAWTLPDSMSSALIP